MGDKIPNFTKYGKIHHGKQGYCHTNGESFDENGDKDRKNSDFHNTDPGILDGVKEFFGEGCIDCGRTDFSDGVTVDEDGMKNTGSF